MGTDHHHVTVPVLRVLIWQEGLGARVRTDEEVEQASCATSVVTHLSFSARVGPRPKFVEYTTLALEFDN